MPKIGLNVTFHRHDTELLSKHKTLGIKVFEDDSHSETSQTPNSSNHVSQTLSPLAKSSRLVNSRPLRSVCLRRLTRRANAQLWCLSSSLRRRYRPPHIPAPWHNLCFRRPNCLYPWWSSCPSETSETPDTSCSSGFLCRHDYSRTNRTTGVSRTYTDTSETVNTLIINMRCSESLIRSGSLSGCLVPTREGSFVVKRVLQTIKR